MKFKKRHLRNRLVHLLSVWKARKLLRKAKYVHLIDNDKFGKPFVEFLNRNFSTDEHVVLCKRTTNHPFPEGPNVLEIHNYFGLDLDRDNIEKIICHSLLVPKTVDYLYKHLDVQRRKAFWLIWGADLYKAKRDEKNDTLRRNFKGYIGAIDRHYARAKYGISGDFFDLHLYAVNQIPLRYLLAAKGNKSVKPRIQINNSCDASTIEAMKALARHAGKIVVTTILSYGDMKWKDEIIELGNKLFGDDFEPITEYMNAQDFSEFLKGVDVYVLNQRRQQGVTTLVAHLELGHKAYIREDVTTYRYLHEHGVDIGDSCKLRDMTLEEVLYYPEVSRQRARKVCRELWLDEKLVAARLDAFFKGSLPPCD